MHRELKSGFGLGEQQAWSPTAAQATVAWVVWTYALLVLTGYRVWGLGPGTVPALGRWYTARRWSLGAIWQALRAELWQEADLSPGWTRFPDTWAEMATWSATRTTATRLSPALTGHHGPIPAPPTTHRAPGPGWRTCPKQPNFRIVYVGEQNGVDADGTLAGDDLGSQTQLALRNVLE